MIILNMCRYDNNEMEDLRSDLKQAVQPFTTLNLVEVIDAYQRWEQVEIYKDCANKAIVYPNIKHYF